MRTTGAIPARPRTALLRWTCSVVVLAAAVWVASCSGGARKSDNLDRFSAQAPEVLGQASSGRQAESPDRPQGPSPQGASHEDWTIALAVIPQSDANRAKQALARAHDLGLAAAHLQSRRSGWVVAYGKYDSPDSAQARRDLAMVKALQAGDSRPFATAMLLPPEQKAAAGSLPDLDLRNARRLFGKDAKYTLQVNAYARPDGSKPTESELAEFRRLAEEGAQELRRQGERAFYYHGPNMSLVTVGVFSDADLAGNDFDEAGRPVPRPESMALQEARRKFPHMLLNGKGMRVRAGGVGEGTLARSELVQIPEK